MEAKLIPAENFPIEWIEIGGLKRVGFLRTLETLAELPWSVWQASRILDRASPAAVFSMGGYVAGPVLLAALWKRIPVVVMEPNAIPGFTHRRFARFVARALIAFPETARWFPAGRSEVTGRPVGEEFFAVPVKPSGKKLTVLITGGSQGSRTLNRAVEESWPLWKKGQVRLLHQTGAADYEEIARRFRASGVEGEVTAFLKDMPRAFAEADLVVSRSGMGAVTELAAAGKPSILVPLPTASDQHQLRNAEALAAAGAARMVLDGEMNGKRLVKEVKELVQLSSKLAAMGTAARSLARPGAAARAADILESFGSRGAPHLTVRQKPKQYTIEMFFRPQPVHFVGIGGIGMSGLAEVLLELGYKVSGSDLKRSPATDRLASKGATIFEGHSAANVCGAKALVYSSAVQSDNPEVVEARRLAIPAIPRGELLAELMRLKYGIAIAGSHGKTTTTSMVAAILSHGGLDPTVVVGGRVGIMGGSNVRVGKSEFLVVESDESDGSFLKLAPILAIVTNIDREHLDHYADIGEIRHAFTQFVSKVPFYGAAILCLDDENVQQILPVVNRRTVTYGTSAQADLRITHSSMGHMASEFHLESRGRDLGCLRLNVPGAHNVLNAAAAVAVGLELDLPIETIREALAAFSGVERRFQLRGTERGITVIDDYGHHPTEIRATLSDARDCRYSNIHVLFQPHRFTRTQALLDDFASAFHQADSVHVMDIYAASEMPIEGVTAEVLVERIRAFGHRDAHYVGSMERGFESALESAAHGDAIVTLGAGSVYQAGRRNLQRLGAAIKNGPQKYEGPCCRAWKKRPAKPRSQLSIRRA